MPPKGRPSVRQAGQLAQWSAQPRFEERFWTDAPLVNREKILQSQELNARGKKQIKPHNAEPSLSIKPEVQPSTPRLAPGNLPQWSAVPRFEPEFWTEAPMVNRTKLVADRHNVAGGKRRCMDYRDHLYGGAQVDSLIVPPTPPPWRSNNSGILKARKANCDHLRGIAEVNPDIVNVEERHFDQNSGIVKARKANCDHLNSAATVNDDVVPHNVPKQFSQNPDILRARNLNCDHLTGAASINCDLVPEEIERHRYCQQVTHLHPGSAMVNEEKVGGEKMGPAVKFGTHPDSHMDGGGVVLKDDRGSQQTVLRDWWGKRASGSGASQALHPDIRHRGRAPSIVTTISARSNVESIPGSARREQLLRPEPAESVASSQRVAPSIRSARSAASSALHSAREPRRHQDAASSSHAAAEAPRSSREHHSHRHRKASEESRHKGATSGIDEFLKQDRAWAAEG